MPFLGPAEKTPDVGGFIRWMVLVGEQEAAQTGSEARSEIGGLFAKVVFGPNEEIVPLFQG